MRSSHNSDDSDDESDRLRHYFHFSLDCLISLVLGLLLATLVSRQLWVPMPTPEEARVQCTSSEPYNVTTREFIQLGFVTLDSHWSQVGQYRIQKRIPVDVIYLLHPIICNGTHVRNYTHLRVEDAFAFNEGHKVTDALNRIVHWNNVTRYAYEWCLFRDCLYNEPVEEMWGIWVLAWLGGVMCTSSLIVFLLYIPATLHKWYDKQGLYEAFMRVLYRKEKTVANRYTDWNTECV